MHRTHKHTHNFLWDQGRCGIAAANSKWYAQDRRNNTKRNHNKRIKANSLCEPPLSATNCYKTGRCHAGALRITARLYHHVRAAHGPPGQQADPAGCAGEQVVVLRGDGRGARRGGTWKWRGLWRDANGFCLIRTPAPTKYLCTYVGR